MRVWVASSWWWRGLGFGTGPPEWIQHLQKKHLQHVSKKGRFESTRVPASNRMAPTLAELQKANVHHGAMIRVLPTCRPAREVQNHLRIILTRNSGSRQAQLQVSTEQPGLPDHPGPTKAGIPDLASHPTPGPRPTSSRPPSSPRPDQTTGPA